MNNNNLTFTSEEEFDDTDYDSPEKRTISTISYKQPLNGSNENRPKYNITPKHKYTHNRTTTYDDDAEDQLVKTTKLISDDNKLVSPDRRNSLASSPTKIKYTQVSFEQKEFAVPDTPSKKRLDVSKTHTPRGINTSADINKINSSPVVQMKRKPLFSDSPKKKNKLDDPYIEATPIQRLEDDLNDADISRASILEKVNSTLEEIKKAKSSPLRLPVLDKIFADEERLDDVDQLNTEQKRLDEVNQLREDEHKRLVDVDLNQYRDEQRRFDEDLNQLRDNDQQRFTSDEENHQLRHTDEHQRFISGALNISRDDEQERFNEGVNQYTDERKRFDEDVNQYTEDQRRFDEDVNKFDKDEHKSLDEDLQLTDTVEQKRFISDEDLIRKVEAQMLHAAKPISNYPSRVDFESKSVSKVPDFVAEILAKTKPVSNYNYPSKDFESKPSSKTDFNPIPTKTVQGSNNESKHNYSVRESSPLKHYPVRGSSPLKHQAFPLVESTPKIKVAKKAPSRKSAIPRKQLWQESKTQNLSDEEWTKLYRLLDQFSPDQIANSAWLMDELKCTRHELEQKVQFLLDYRKKFERFTD